MVFDMSKPSVNNSDFERKDWSCSELSSTIRKKRKLYPKTPTSKGMGFTIVEKVDVDHAGDTVSRRSRAGFIVCLNSALVNWWSKNQNSVGTSSFGSGFIVMKQLYECF